MRKIKTISRADEKCFSCTLSSCIAGAAKSTLDAACARQRLININPESACAPFINEERLRSDVDQRTVPVDETRYILHTSV